MTWFTHFFSFLHITFFLKDGQISGNEKTVKTPTKVFENKNLSIVLSKSSFNLSWEPQNHQFFFYSFKLSVKVLVCCLKVIQKNAGLKIPKFVLYEIIRFFSFPPFVSPPSSSVSDSESPSQILTLPTNVSSNDDQKSKNCVLN